MAFGPVDSEGTSSGSSVITGAAYFSLPATYVTPVNTGAALDWTGAGEDLGYRNNAGVTIDGSGVLHIPSGVYLIATVGLIVSFIGSGTAPFFEITLNGGGGPNLLFSYAAAGKPATISRTDTFVAAEVDNVLSYSCGGGAAAQNVNTFGFFITRLDDYQP